jgi:hypothetical protein
MKCPGRELMPIIREAVMRGQSVRFSVDGGSMFPFICSGDEVELEPSPVLRLGDIVLVESGFSDISESYVLHRIVWLGSGKIFLIRGDSQSHSEGPFMPDAVIGKVNTVWHKGRIRSLDRGFWRITGLIWLKTSPFGHYLLRIVLSLRRFYNQKKLY